MAWYWILLLVLLGIAGGMGAMYLYIAFEFAKDWSR